MSTNLLLYLITALATTTCLAAQGTALNAIGAGEIVLRNCAAINSPDVDFGPALFRDKLVFLTRPRRGGVDPATGQPYFKLFSASVEEGELPTKARRFSTALSGSYNEGPVSFTQQNQVIYFTRTLQRSGGIIEGPAGEVNLGIFSAYFDGFDWAAIRPMVHNDPAYTNQHPTLTPDGRRLFFASNRPGGFGGYDLYFADYRDGAWGAAVNLGPEINTDGNEAFPFIHPTGRLFFSSNGHPGLGGYDVFNIDISKRVWGALTALPEPINSAHDDITFTLSVEGSNGYLSSNRPGGVGADDIYQVSLQYGLESLRPVEAGPRNITLYDAASSKRIEGAAIWIAELTEAGRLPAGMSSFQLKTVGNRNVVEQELLPPGYFDVPPGARTNVQGVLAYPFKQGKSYFIAITKPGYATKTMNFEPAPDDPPGLLDIGLERSECLTVSGKVEDARGIGVEGLTVSYGQEEGKATRYEGRTDRRGYFSVCLPPNVDYLTTVTGRGLSEVSDGFSSAPHRCRATAASPDPTSRTGRAIGRPAGL